MDAAFFGNWDTEVTPCDEPASVEIHGYELCRGCHEALVIMGGLFTVRTARDRRSSWWICLNWKLAQVALGMLKAGIFFLVMFVIAAAVKALGVYLLR
jgi:hypothetical protein